MNSAPAQNITPNAQQFFQQALAATDLNQKIPLLESALRLSPQYVDARLELAKTLMQAQQFRRALFQLDTVLSTNSKNAEAWFYKGRAHAELAEFNTALSAFKKAIDLQENRSEFYIEMGKAQFANKSFDAALQSFEQGLSLAIPKKDTSAQAEAWFGKGRAHEAKGDTTNAVRSYRQTLQLRPAFKAAKTYLTNLENQAQLEVWFQAAEEAFRRGDWKNAALNYQQILAVNSNFKNTSQKLALVQNKMRAQALADSAWTLRQRQKFDAAIILLQQAIALDAERRSELQAQINQIELAKQLAGNKTKTTEPAPPKEISSQKDSSAADTTSKLSAIASNDSTNRQLISKNRSLTSTLKWTVVIVVILLIVIFVIVRIGKYPIISKSPEPTVPPPPPTEPSQPEPMRDLIKVIMAKQLQATPLPANIIHPAFERFPLERLLGLGGMGRVYKAYDKKLKRTVALKAIIQPESVIDRSQFAELRRRFEREAQNTAQLSHPNIVNLYEFYDERDGVFFMTMEYIEGATVLQLLQEKKRLAARDAVPIIKQACEALEYAHKRDVIHRDIKPSNLMLNAEATVKVVDFGIAKILTMDAAQTSLTPPGYPPPGTPSYMSPEQWNAETLDGRSDIFSLGIVFYEMLAGEHPFIPKAETSYEKMRQAILNGKPPKLKLLCPEVVPRLEAIVEKMLAQNPEQRYPNAAEIIKTLNTLAV